ncbi:hypothetical protein [Planctomicrobium sp. SH527]|uniref:hypothetical protein n=1 Tax=Planctomicrobium sp. SH527 TaxID=3448123 RepID=UPI003F5CAAD2
MTKNQIQIPCLILVLLTGAASADDRGPQDLNFQQSPNPYLHGSPGVPQVPGRGNFRILESGFPIVLESRNPREQPAELLERRIHSLNVAAENLREAGFQEEAERLQAKAADLDRERIRRMGAGGNEEIRNELVALRNVIVQLRSEVSALRRQIEMLEQRREPPRPVAIPQPYHHFPQSPVGSGQKEPSNALHGFTHPFGVPPAVQSVPQIRPRVPLELLDQPVPMMIAPLNSGQATQDADPSETPTLDSDPKVELKFEQTETTKKSLEKTLPKTPKKTPGK